jgi:hypothetical protein
MLPGAIILLRTPQGEFTVTYGTTLLLKVLDQIYTVSPLSPTLS